MENVWEAVPLIVFFGVVAYVVKIILENATKRKLIDKGMVDENIKYLYADRPESRILSALKWGMVSVAIGLAVFVGQMGPSHLVEEITIGAMFVFAGLALVIYYAIANKMLDKSKKESSEIQSR
ncbi:MAG: hypothetical protein KAW02_00635 [candidate division Zixibacteria bacterium]|nr:hypothetical protein [candidate division Zixibacteria bacterium]